MEDKKSNSTFKIISGILAILLVATAAFAYKFHNDGETTKSELNKEKLELNKEKDVVLADLQEMVDKYDVVIEDNSLKDTELNEARDKIESLINDIGSKEASIASLSRFRTEVIKLREERNLLFAQNDSLRISNDYLTKQISSTSYQLEQQIGMGDSLSMENNKLAERVKIGAELVVNNLKTTGVIVRSSGKLIENSRARRVDKIRVCYTVPQNRLSRVADRELFVQVLDPSGKVLGQNKTVSFVDMKELTYSKISKFHYEATALDICENIEPSGDKFTSGTYKVRVYDKSTLLEETSLSLK